MLSHLPITALTHCVTINLYSRIRKRKFCGEVHYYNTVSSKKKMTNIYNKYLFKKSNKYL
jgi:hypothetical protein